MNKLGDAERKVTPKLHPLFPFPHTTQVASSVCHVLHKLLMMHPVMTEVVAKEVMRLLFDSKTSARARYYGQLDVRVCVCVCMPTRTQV